MNITNLQEKSYTMTNFHEDFDEALHIVYNCGFHQVDDTNHYNIEFMNKARALGDCLCQGGNTYRIRLNQIFANVSSHDAIINTLVHELLHSLPNCMCHTGQWKKNASIVYRKTGINIQRVATASECMEYHKEKAIKVINNNPNKVVYVPYCEKCGYEYKAYQRKSQTVSNIIKYPNHFCCTKCNSKNSMKIKTISYTDFAKKKFQLDI